jgi:hypothetical protein
VRVVCGKGAGLHVTWAMASCQGSAGLLITTLSLLSLFSTECVLSIECVLSTLSLFSLSPFSLSLSLSLSLALSLTLSLTHTLAISSWNGSTRKADFFKFLSEAAVAFHCFVCMFAVRGGQGVRGVGAGCDWCVWVRHGLF